MKSPVALFRLYLAQLWVHLSVVRMPNDQEHSAAGATVATVNRTYLATCIAFGIGAIYGTLGLHLESGHPLTIDSLRATPYLVVRQVTLQQIWSQMDIMWVVVIFSELIILHDFAFKAVQWQHQYIIDKQSRVKLAGKALSQYESTKLLAVFHRARISSNIFAFAFYPPELLYSYAMVFLVSQVYFVSFCSLAYWFIVYPFTLLIIALCKAWENS